MSKFFSGFLIGLLVAYFLMRLAEKNQSQIKETLDSWKRKWTEKEGAVKSFIRRKKADFDDSYNEKAPEAV